MQNLAYGYTERIFVDAGTRAVAGNGNEFTAGGFFRADGPILVRAHLQGHNGLAEGFDVIHGGWLLHITIGYRERRAIARHTAFALQRFDQCRLLTANVGAGAEMDVDVEIEAFLVKDICTQQLAVAAALQHGLQGIKHVAVFTAQVKETFFRTNRQCAQRHAFEHQIGLFVEQHAILEGAGLALVGVAHHIMRGTLRIAAGFPFQTGGETCAAASAQGGSLDGFDNFLPTQR